MTAFSLLLVACAGSRSTDPPRDFSIVDLPPWIDGSGSREGGRTEAGAASDSEVPFDLGPPWESGGALCSNGTCDKASGENCTTCPKDCACGKGFYCAGSLCKTCIAHKATGCTADVQCCQAPDDICKNSTCCRPLGATCSGPNDCCNASASCSTAGKCCMPVGTSCWSPTDCCGAHQCTGGKCV